MAEADILESKKRLAQSSKENVVQAEAAGEIISDNDTVVEWIGGGEEEEVDNDRVALGLIGNIWMNRYPDPVAFISTMKGVWSVKNGVEIVNIGRNLYQIQFSIGEIRRKFQMDNLGISINARCCWKR